jgi:hypothetical protein
VLDSSKRGQLDSGPHVPSPRDARRAWSMILSILDGLSAIMNSIALTESGEQQRRAPPARLRAELPPRPFGHVGIDPVLHSLKVRPADDHRCQRATCGEKNQRRPSRNRPKDARNDRRPDDSGERPTRLRLTDHWPVQFLRGRTRSFSTFTFCRQTSAWSFLPQAS